MILELVDGGILEIESDTWSQEGCETCDYGSQYVNEFSVELTTGVIKVKVENMYHHVLTENTMMKVILPNVDTIKSKSEKEFLGWLEPTLEGEIKSNAYDWEVTVVELSIVWEGKSDD